MGNDVDTAQAVVESLQRIEALLHALLYAITHDADEDEDDARGRTLDGEPAGGERQQDLPL